MSTESTTAAEKATRKIRESIERRAAARRQAGDADGLEALYTATMHGRDTIADAYRKLTGRAIADPTETPAEAVYRADADAGEQAEQIEQLVRDLAQCRRERQAADEDKQMYRERAEETGRKLSEAVAEAATLRRDLEAARAMLAAAAEAEADEPAPEIRPAAKVTPQVETGAAGATPLGIPHQTPAEVFEELHREDPDPAEQRPEPTPAEADAERARRQYISRETADLFRYVMDNGGIRPSSPDLAPEYAENIPPSYRRRAPHGLPGDELASQLETDRPELGIRTENDLLEFFGSRRRQAAHARATS